MRCSTNLVAFLAATILLGPAYRAASPPTLVNYQGVLRDASDQPLDGDHDMVFRFFSAEIGGEEILVDLHTTANSAPVVVVEGLFGVQLGSGVIQDGSGPGTHTSLATVFRDYGDVWLSVEIGGELLDPRIRIAAAPYAHNAKNLDGRSAAGFINTTGTAQTKAGRLTIDNAVSGQYGLEVYGMEGAYFQDADQSGQAWIANGNWGVGGKGNVAGGSFEDLDDSGYAHVGIGDHGIQAYGDVAGGSFDDLDNTSTAQIAFSGFGVYAQGEDAGGYFDDLNQSGYAFVANGDYGIRAYGDFVGGSFENTLGGSYAHVGRENYGIRAAGNLAGGTFDDRDGSGYAYVGYGDRGIYAEGNLSGGSFNELDSSAYARVAFEDRGIWAEGNESGGEFRELDSSAVAYVASGDYGIRAGGGAGVLGEDLGTGTWGVLALSSASTTGNGSKNFVQNHPYDSDRVVVYTSLEGDEAGTYTRGTAKLVDGEARVSLGETFAWVTNPDIGLTAHLTARGDCRGLYVESLTTSELVVRERDGGASDTVFDYVVFGLRIGFEESSVIRRKTIESFIPSMNDERDVYERHPELRSFNALERFKGMAAKATGVDDVDLSRAAELRAAIQEYDPAVHGSTDQLLGHGPPPRELEAGEGSPPEPANAATVDVEPDPGSLEPRQEQTAGPAPPVPDTAATVHGEPFPASEPVAPGDVISLDLDRPGNVRPAFTMVDPGVIGVAVGAIGDGPEARVVVTGLAECRVDAGYGAIRAGDLLTSSPTRGHAMRAIDAPAGTILGKALEPLETGTGTIRILVMPR